MIGRFLPLLLLLLCGCSPLLHGPQDQMSVVENVPYRAGGSRGDCGPAALSSLLAHRGKDVPAGDIAEELYIPELGGSLLPDLENYARKIGFSPRSGRGDPHFLRSAIAAGSPVLIFVESGFWVFSSPHYLVVYGYGEGGFLVHGGREAFMTTGDLLSRWDRMNNLYLVLE